jgi:N-methylhydantoinase A
VAALAAALDLESVACAEGIVRVADAEMLRALRVMTVNRGIDPRRFTLMPFGGAGPLHAAAIAEELGIASVLCPRASGVLSALGLAAAAPRRDAARTVLLSGPGFCDDAVARVAAGLLEEAAAGFAGEVARTRVLYELRYSGQSFELAVEGAADADADVLREAFAHEHEERYGYRDPDGEVELVTVRASAWGPTPQPHLQAPADGTPRQRRQPAVFDGREHDAVLWSGAPPPGTRIAGPAICALAESTVAVPPGWDGQVDEQGSILLRRPAAGVSA